MIVLGFMTEPDDPPARQREIMRCPQCQQDYEVTDFEATLYHASAHTEPQSGEDSEA